MNNVCGCKPDCTGKCSGKDGCGGTCSAPCPSPQTCGGGPTPDICGCTPKCTGKCGGDDGCGSTCPDKCDSPQTCAGNGTPLVCETPPACTTASGATWSSVARTSTSPPSGTTNCALVYDTARDRIVYFNGVIWEWDPSGNTWTWLHLTSQPSDSLASTAFVYDSARGKILLFGGWDASGACNETWEWDGASGSWSNKNPSVVPPKSSEPYMAFDPVRTRMVMVTSPSNGEPATWEWDGSNWSELVPSGGGTPFNLRHLEWDSGHGRILGISDTDPGPEVWQWNPSSRTWTRLSFGCTPSSRGMEAVVYLPGKDQMVFFGGNNGSALQDLWAWAPDGSSWRHYQQAGTWPTPRGGGSLAYDSLRKRLVMFHGSDGSSMLNDLWTLSVGP